jgi:hypothetical protein
MVDDSDAAEARAWGSACLRVLASMSCEAEDPALRAYARRELEVWLVDLRKIVAAPGTEPEVRHNAEAALLGFWQA